MGNNETRSTLKGSEMSQEIVELRVDFNHQFEKTNIVLAIMRTFTKEVPWPEMIYTSPYMNGKNCGWHLTYFDGKKTNVVNLICHHISDEIVIFCGDSSMFCSDHGHVTSDDVIRFDYKEDYHQAALAITEYLLSGEIDTYFPKDN